MGKILLIALLLSLALLLYSCAEEVETAEPVALSEEQTEESINLSEEAAPPTASAPTGPCTAAWLCLNSDTKIYRLENCSFGKREKCKFGCANDSCRPASICTVGFKCKGNYYKGYQLEDCSWTAVTQCEWGCANAECLAEPNVTESAAPPPAQPSAPARPSGRLLAVRQVDTVNVGGAQHNISIYDITDDEVRFLVDGHSTDWIGSGGNRTAWGLTLTVLEVYFQRYGKQEVEYKVE